MKKTTENLVISLWFVLMGFLLLSVLFGLIPPGQEAQEPEDDPRTWVWDA